MDNITTTSSGAESSAPQYTLSEWLGFHGTDLLTVATKGVKRARTVAADDLDADYDMGLLDQEDTWIGVQPVKPGTKDKRTSAKDVLAVRVLYADFDFKSADEPAIRSAIAQLSDILDTGVLSIVNSGGGLHPRWLLAESLQPEDAKGLLERWKFTVQRVARENGFEADSVFDLPRVLRLPGTVNEKYDPPRPVTLEVGQRDKAVVKRVLWSRLDTKSGVSPLNDSQAPQEKPAELQKAPERPQIEDTITERYLSSQIIMLLDRLTKMDNDGWDGEPWHNGVRDVSYQLAKIGLSPEMPRTIDAIHDLYLQSAPRDEMFGPEEHEELWASALERAGGETYAVMASGDDLFADEFESMLSETRENTEQSRNNLDIDAPDLLAGLGTEPPEPRDNRTAQERYDSLPLPLVPGFNGVAALRRMSLEGISVPLDNRMTVLGEDISDLHELQHVEYMHPHCPLCFPHHWREQLHRWIIANPRLDSRDIRPPLGKSAPGEGYLDGFAALELSGEEMIVQNVIPRDSIGVVRGRGGAGKTFIGLDLAMNILDPTKRDWGLLDGSANEHAGKVGDHGAVMILAGEGFVGLGSRLRAWLDGNGHRGEVPEWMANLTARGEIPDFFAGGADFDALLSRVAQEQPKAIIIDTLQRAAGTADQNNASDMKQVSERLLTLKKATNGGSVVVIAHTNKEDTTTRGSSSIEDDADFILHVKKEPKSSTVEVVKMRDGELLDPFDFYLVPEAESVRPSAFETEEAHSLYSSEQDMIDLLTGMFELTVVMNPDDDMTLSDINKQIPGRDQGEIVRLLGAGHADGYVGVSGSKKFKLTPRGRAWIESKSSRLFATSSKGH